MNQEAVLSLRAAVEQSPENIHLRLLLAQALLSANRYAEAEAEYKFILENDAKNHQAQHGFALACFEQRKFSVAYVVLEQLCNQSSAPAASHILFVKLLLIESLQEEASRQYSLALAKDPAAGDPAMDKLFSVQRVAIKTETAANAKEIKPEAAERPKVSFKDVGGMEELKEEIRVKIIYPQQKAELYKAFSKKAGGGLLLYGPPGCGKTFIAKATAGEMGAAFVNIAISDVLDPYIGQSERNMHNLFVQARESAPCVVFIDEMDALGGKRYDNHHQTGKQLINQFLVEMDGMNSSNEGILFIGATNMPWAVDSAFRRPGRFDDVIFVPPPDLQARKEILQLYLRDKPARQIDIAALASYTKGWSGADLRGLVERAIELRLRTSMKSGQVEPITQHDLVTLMQQTHATTLEWFTTAENYATFANQAGIYDALNTYLRNKR